MSAKPWHRRYHSDALAGMLSLTLEERGAYQTCLDLIYDRQGPIPDNDRLLAGYMGCSIRKWKALRERLLMLGKLIARDGMLTNARAEKEIENDAKTARKHAENGLKGGRKRAENEKKANENNERSQAGLKHGSSLPEARSQKPDIEKDKNRCSVTPRASPAEPDYDRQELERMAQALALEIRLIRPIAPKDRQVLKGWLDEGFHFENIVMEAAKHVYAREAAKGLGISGFAYLDGAVRDEAAEVERERERYREMRERLTVIEGGGR